MFLRLSRFAVMSGAMLLSFTANAQLFGPDSLEECILGKMKGQSPNMIGVARAACLKQFPQEIKLNEDIASSKWCETTSDTISACVVLKDGYKISRAVATFSKTNCVPNIPADDDTFETSSEAKLPMFGSTYKFPVVSAASYKCARFEFYGHRKP